MPHTALSRSFLQPPILLRLLHDPNQLTPACDQKCQHQRPNHKPDNPHDPQSAEEPDPHNRRVNRCPLPHHDWPEQEVRDRTDDRIPDDRNQGGRPVIPGGESKNPQEDHNQRRADNRNQLEQCHNQRPEDDVPVSQYIKERDCQKEGNHRRGDMDDID